MKTIAIIGLGLMGGSLAARVRGRFPKVRVIGISRNRQAIRVALKKRWIHEGSNRLEAARSADFVVLCTPVDTFAKFLLALEKICRPGTLVTDVGSVKGEILRWTGRKKFTNIQFVGAHPMAGSHVRGIEAARENLFDHSLIFIVRSPVSPGAYKAVKKFWKNIAPRIMEVSAAEHDKITGQISHLPHALAACLALTPDEKNLKFAAAGFADTTRVAAGDASVWLPILLSNREELSRSLGIFRAKLSGLQKILLENNGPALLKLLRKAGKRREGI
ncbi:MAG TPA: prephenate dehydrogenase/arogenate dehydrogenase family protein [bacterium]|nr:prephenate dehydrogenase/arogenate dehydrogenase family protein [bacterium]